MNSLIRPTNCASRPCRSVNPPHQRTGRRGASPWIVLVSLALLSLPAAIWTSLTDWFSAEPAPDFLTAEVVSDAFVHEVIEHGEIESSSNVEVRCEVRSRSSSGTNILEIVPEGTRVQAGDFLVRLDDAALQTDLIQQQIVVTNSRAQVIEAQATYDSAILALSEYESGTFREQEEQLESSEFVAEENVRRAQEYLHYSQRLAERGYIPEVQLEADRFAVEKAKKELEVAKTKLSVLREFTKKKMLTSLKADIETAKARLESREKTKQLDEVRLKEIEEQIEKCVLTAPVAGQVVYGNSRDRRGSSGELLIEEGRPVRERQVIVRLPDPTKMRVLAKVHESRISHVAVGTRARIVLDALPELDLVGKVATVSEYPLPSISVYMSHIKEYAVEIDIDNPPEGLRPGMTSQVAILVAREAEAIQVPIQAIIERSDRNFAAVLHKDGFVETREVTVGHVNEEAVVIQKGLAVGEDVILTPGRYEELLNLPEEERKSDSKGLADALPAIDLNRAIAAPASGGKQKPKGKPKPGKASKPGKSDSAAMTPSLRRAGNRA